MSQIWPNMQVTVMGLGRFGGGAGVTRWLLDQGASVRLTDTAPADQLESQRAPFDADIEAGRLTTRFGGHETRDFEHCDLVVANPAVPRPWDNPYLRAAMDADVPVTTEIRLLTERINRDRTIGVTGSAGKSTTTSMIHHILHEANHPVRLGGNIGGSLLPELNAITPDEWIVLELSSAMLYWLGERIGFNDAPGWSPHIALLTNISPNHLDWHRDMACYEHCKHNIFRYQASDDRQLTRQDQDASRVPLEIPGEHNQVNARFAADAVAAATGCSQRDALGRLETFRGLPHRLELVCSIDGCRFYNDSKSTTPDASIRAVDAFDDSSRVHLIAGGYDKSIDLQPIADLVTRVAGIYTIGTTGPEIHRRASAIDDRRSWACVTLDRAVEHARARMAKGDLLLLSPGCASWDQFDHFEQRGERFASLVQPHVTSS
ncbi:MAG: UDP-N-acetylmuramoyl-L-alanine--D-glutamate ligase [Planctomycetota bacterium]